MNNMYRCFFKRMLDIIISLVILSLTFPLMILIALLIRIFLGAPILFAQVRPGLHEKPFKLYKFRTMANNNDADGALLSDEKRMTSLGKLLRQLSLDELPEIINILKGDMSLIGPRPLLMEYLPYYSSEQRRRHTVLPGLTGWAQINGRNSISWEDKFKFDNWYVDHCSFLTDCKIFFLTIKKVIKREGVAEEGHVTMSKFSNKEN
jgi:sugar transferase EpsL